MEISYLAKSLILLLSILRCVSANPVNSEGFECGDGQMVPYSWACDGVEDCSNGKDERECNYVHQCRAGEYMCRDSGECLKASSKCDGASDCTDASDEKDCDTIWKSAKGKDAGPQKGDTPDTKSIIESGFNWIYIVLIVLAVLVLIGVFSVLYFCLHSSAASAPAAPLS